MDRRRSGRIAAKRDPLARAASDDEIITGVHAVAESMAAGEKIERLLIGVKREKDPSIKNIIDGARAAAIPIAFESDDAFHRFRHENHQHVAAVVKRFAYTPWADVRAAVRADTNALVVALDHVEDPHNLGAVMRNAEGAGATSVVIPDRRSAAVTPAARRAAAGAASHLRVATVPNLVRALEDLKADGCWVYGLSTAPAAVSYTSIDFTGRCVIVIGAEGKGLSRLTSERCDRLASIPLAGKVSSLNASSAAAIALFEALRQRAHAAIVTP
jgi:23S rRNA (guanosine2251-2'-O)-methyltransferase